MFFSEKMEKKVKLITVFRTIDHVIRIENESLGLVAFYQSFPILVNLLESYQREFDIIVDILGKFVKFEGT